MIRALPLTTWLLAACAGCATVPPAPTSSPSPPAAVTPAPAAPASTPPPAAAPGPGQAKTPAQAARSTPAAGAAAEDGRDNAAPATPGERSPEGSAGDASAPATGTVPGAAAIYVPRGSGPDDMTPAPKEETRPQSLQGGAGAAQPSPSPSGGNSTAGVTLSVAVPAGTIQVGGSLTVEIAVTSSAGVVDAPLHLIYDPALLRYLAATEGEYMKKDGGGTVFLANGESRPGDVTIGIGRTDRSRGAFGSGTLCRVRFAVLAPGTATLTIGPAMAWAVDGSLLPVTTRSAEIRITEAG